ncbi:hypothetical protein CERZMDRAFT_38631 [Cercospora zeae-maydis SCOH1-5]|uniref:Uncharacterized protein n=1 Tax=Cercospora zeae-maydis SCOH1-5 TaxID=717836 RepID=A0A6A6FKW7_9PEZI|nr:hypothetical protein CERZMDRAFT_38631 [Cercospora zeae-maydis SCOH1-5]
MPARVSRSSVPINGPKQGKTAKNKSKKRSLDAYARAEKSVPQERLGIAKHRLGEIEDDGPRHKRQRRDSNEKDDEDEDEEPQRKRPAQRRVKDDDGDAELGSDSSGNEWTMGGLAEDDEDSDLDSDEAFGDSDEEKFEGFTFRGSKNLKGKKSKGGKTPQRKGLDLDEQEGQDDDSGDSQDEEGLGFGDEAVDLAAMLDEPASDDDAQQEGSGSEKDEEGYDSESESEEDSDDDVDDEEKAARMRDRLEALDSKSSKDKSGPTASGADIDMNDLFADFAADVAPTTDKSKKAKKRAQQAPISAPLPKRQQDRIDREIATAKAKETLDRWKNTVIQNRRAEHLSFPLQHPDDTGVTVGKEKFTPATQGAPANELEESIQRIMEESGLATQRDTERGPEEEDDEEAALLKAEGMAEKHMDVEEVMRRRTELRKQRALLFREEIKAKRIAKIKSKSYRRVHRKERERAKEQEQLALGGLDYDAMDEDAKEKHDRQRAEARMSTRHKDSKWAKSLKQTNRTAWDDNARDGAVEQARRNEELKKRMAGKDIADDEGSLSPDSDDEEVTAEQLDALQNEAGSKKGLAGLKFMQKSEEKRKKANDEAVERIRRDLAIADGDEAESEADDEGLGRAIFGPSSKEQKRQAKRKQEFEAPEDSDEEAEAREAAEAGIVVDKPQSKEKSALNGSSKKSTSASGPLAKGMSKQPERTESKKEYGGWLSTGGSKSKKSNAAAEADIITPSAIISSPKKPVKSSAGMSKPKTTDSAAGNTNGWTTVSIKNDAANDEDASDAEPTNAILDLKEKQQLSLQERAFAGDDVVAAFEAEKADMIASEDEKETSNYLPGWGSWTGTGLSKSLRKANKKAQHNPLYKTRVAGVRASERSDRNLDKVIISEKQDRKGKKYLAPTLPHEFETREQYERSRRLPVGPEWTTKEVHQKMVKPRVVVKKGVNLEAIGRPVA